jgi:hypothetical protein
MEKRKETTEYAESRRGYNSPYSSSSGTRNRHSHFDSFFPSIEDRGFPRWVAIYSPDREGRINPIKGDT